MTAKEYVKIVARQNVILRRDKEELERLRTRVLSVNAPTDKINVITGGGSDAQAANIESLMKLKDEIADYIVLAEKDRRIILEQLDSLSNPREIQYIMDVYIRCNSITETANKNLVGEMTVKRYLKKGLEEFETLYPEIKDLDDARHPGDVARFWRLRRKGEFCYG